MIDPAPVHLRITHSQTRAAYPACLYQQDRVIGTTTDRASDVSCGVCAGMLGRSA